jgi:hypothetical protein
MRYAAIFNALFGGGAGAGRGRDSLRRRRLGVAGLLSFGEQQQ